MDTQSLPIVPFGKYKGQPITNLLNDSKYLEWCKQQEWFQKYPIVYNICANQTISANNQNSKTPEHNKMQNLFLEKDNVEKFLRLLYKKFKYRKNISYKDARCEFEGSFNWDIIIDGLCITKINCTCNWDEKGEDEICECKYDDNDEYVYELSNIFIEVKPLLGDDYPCILRKMKLQKELTLNKFKKYRQEMLEEAGYIEGKKSVWDYGGRTLFPDKETLEYVNKNYRIFQGDFILLVKEYESTTTPKDKLIEIFKQSGIRVVFINDVFDNSPCQSQITAESTQQQIIEHEMEELQKTISQAEDKMKKLKQQLKSLKK